MSSWRVICEKMSTREPSLLQAQQQLVEYEKLPAVGDEVVPKGGRLLSSAPSKR